MQKLKNKNEKPGLYTAVILAMALSGAAALVYEIVANDVLFFFLAQAPTPLQLC